MKEVSQSPKVSRFDEVDYWKRGVIVELNPLKTIRHVFIEFARRSDLLDVLQGK